MHRPWIAVCFFLAFIPVKLEPYVAVPEAGERNASAPVLFNDLGILEDIRFAREYPAPLAKLVDVDARAFDNGAFDLGLNGTAYRAREDKEGRENDDTFRFFLEDARARSTIVRSGGKIAGYIETAEGRYSILPLGGTMHLLLPAGRAAVNCSTAEEARAFTGPSRRRSVRSGFPESSGGEIAEITLGLVYSERFEKHFKTPEDALLAIRSLVAAENTALIETEGTFARVVFHSARKISGYDYLPLPQALERFKNDLVVRRARYEERISLTGYLDFAPTGIGAGRASMLVDTPHRNSGMFAMDWNDVAAWQLMVHEVGHLPGLDHNIDPAYPSDPPPCPHCEGYLSCVDRLGDVMSSSGECFVRTYLAYSNPLRTVGGVPFGSARSNGALRWAEQRFVMRDEFWRHALDGVP